MFNNGTLVFATSLLICFGAVSSLRDVKLEVRPSPVIKGGTAALICHRDMQGAPLYSVKWYRGSHEFYRYTPSEQPFNRVFGLPGIIVDVNQSNGSQVLLRKLDISLVGNFSCEVTAESPYFSTQIATKYIDIIALPKEPPALISDKEHYEPGMVLRVNCTSSPSRPAANLSILINDDAYRSTETSLHPSETGYYWSTVSLDLSLTQELFISGRLRVTCVATVYHVYKNSARLDFFTPDVDPRPERITLSGAQSSKFPNWLLLLALVFLPKLVFAQEDFLDSNTFAFDYTYDERSYDDAFLSLV